MAKNRTVIATTGVLSSWANTAGISGWHMTSIVMPLPYIKNIGGEPVYSDPIKKIKHEMGYDVKPDSYKNANVLSSTTGIVSVQPMNLPSGTVFYLDYKYSSDNISATGVTLTERSKWQTSNSSKKKQNG